MCDTTGLIRCMEAQTLCASVLAARRGADFTRTGASTHADQHFPTAPPTTVKVTVFVFCNT